MASRPRLQAQSMKPLQRGPGGVVLQSVPYQRLESQVVV